MERWRLAPRGGVNLVSTHGNLKSLRHKGPTMLIASLIITPLLVIAIGVVIGLMKLQQEKHDREEWEEKEAQMRLRPPQKAWGIQAQQEKDK